jgi:hypothetical protein
MKRQAAQMAAAALCVAALASCAAKPRPHSNTMVPEFIMETLTDTTSIIAADIYPLQPRERRYQVIDDGELIVSCSATSLHQASVACAEGDERTQFLRTEADGSIVMTAVHESSDHALSLFNPPLLIMPAALLPGLEHLATASMRVVDARSPRRVRESGTATRSITYVDDQRIRTPLGEFIAKRLVIHFKADLRMAVADESTTLWVVPARGIGIVAQRSEEQVTVLGFAGKKKIRTMLLIDAH